MRLEIVTDLTSPPVVGRLYQVPAVQIERLSGARGVFFPVVGPAHADADLGADVPHYHFDVRFVDAARLRLIRARHQRPGMTIERVMGYVPTVRSVTEPRLIPMRCRREQPDQAKLEAFWWNSARREWFELEFVGRSLGVDGRCLHRGHDLASVPVRNGCRTCPLHGLRYNAAGVCVARPNSEAPA